MLALAVLAFAGWLDSQTVDDPDRVVASVAAEVGSGTEVCGALPAGLTTWSAAGSPYRLCSGDGTDILVPDGSELVVDASAGPVEVIAQGRPGIEVGGSLRTRGTTERGQVRFTSVTPEAGSWNGLRGGTIDLRHAGISYAGVIGTDVQLHDVVVTAAGCTGSVAVDGPYYSEDSRLVIRRSAIRPELTECFSDAPGPGIILDDATATLEDVEISGLRRSAIKAYSSSVNMRRVHIDAVGLDGYPAVDVTGGTLLVENVDIRNSSVTDRNPAVRLYLMTLDSASRLSTLTGGGNGLDAVEMRRSGFSGSTTLPGPAAPGTSRPLDYVLTGDSLQFGGPIVPAGSTFTVPDGAVLKLLTSALKAQGAKAVFGAATVTSARDNSVGQPLCPSAITGSDCAPRVGDWQGLHLGESYDYREPTGRTADQAPSLQMNGTTMRYADTAVMFATYGYQYLAGGPHVDLRGAVIAHARCGVHVGQAPLVVADSTLSDIGYGQNSASYDLCDPDQIMYARTGIRTPTALNSQDSLDVTRTTIRRTASYAIAAGHVGAPMTLTDITVEGAGSTGTTAIIGSGPDVRLLRVRVTGTASGHAAVPTIALNGYRGALDDAIQDVTGSANSVDAILLTSAQLTGDLTWRSPEDSRLDAELGLIAEDLTLQGPGTVRLPPGGNMRVGGLLTIRGATLDARGGGSTITGTDDPTNGLAGVCRKGPLEYTRDPCSDLGLSGLTVQDDATGPAQLFMTGGTLDFSPDVRLYPDYGLDVGGVRPQGERTSRASALLVDTDVRDAAVSVTGGAELSWARGRLHGDPGRCCSRQYHRSTTAPLLYSWGSPVTLDGIDIDTAQPSRQITFDEVPTDAPVRMSGSRTTSALVSAASDIQVTDTAFEIAAPCVVPLRLTYARLAPTTALAGNSGSGCDVDAIGFDGVFLSGDFTWHTPGRQQDLQPLGYVIGAGTAWITGKLTVPQNAVVQSAGGALVAAGSIMATAGGAVFTDLADAGAPDPACWTPAACAPSQPGAWGGLFAQSGNIELDGATVRHAGAGVRIESDARGTVTVRCSTLTGNQQAVVARSDNGSIHDSNLLDNAELEVTAFEPVAVTRNWWGQAGGPRPEQVRNEPGPADTAQPLDRPSGCAPASEGDSAPTAPEPTVPTAPAGVSATAADESALVRWSASESNGAAVDRYTVTASPGGRTCTTTWQLACSVTSLTNGTPYTFTVTATSAVGTSSTSSPSGPVTPAGVPAAPGQVQVIGADGSAQVSWTATAENGSTVTGYTVTASPGGATTTASGATTRAVVSGLLNGTAYTFVVTATNSVGTSDPSEPSNSVIPSEPTPSEPTPSEPTPSEPTPSEPTPSEPTVAPAPERGTGVTRLAGSDRFTTAAAISAGSFPGTANDVFIVTGTNWPDALSAGPAAAAVNGPVLPVHTGSIPAAILAEIDRLQPRRAWVIGGVGVVNETVADLLRARGMPVDRISGIDRYATAAAVAARFFPSPAGAYYATGHNYVDALGGGAAAAHRGWPLLLTAADSVPGSTPLLGNERIVLGGPAAIGETVRAQLGARRVAGADRYATAAAIALDAFPAAAVTYLATGLNYPDALTGAPPAARDNAPLLLAATNCVTPPTKDAIRTLGATSRVVLGGTAAVTDRAANLTPC